MLQLLAEIDLALNHLALSRVISFSDLLYGHLLAGIFVALRSLNHTMLAGGNYGGDFVVMVNGLLSAY
jgi:hypothetical protein